MLPHTNATVSVKALTQNGRKRSFVTSISSLRVYINQTQEEAVAGIEEQGAFVVFRMMTNGAHAAINVGDQVTDNLGRVFEVRGASAFSDLTGKHNQYILLLPTV